MDIRLVNYFCNNFMGLGPQATICDFRLNFAYVEPDFAKKVRLHKPRELIKSQSGRSNRKEIRLFPFKITNKQLLLKFPIIDSLPVSSISSN